MGRHRGGATAAIDYLIVGHVTQDRVGTRLVLGGSVTYASLTAARLGRRVGVLTSADWEPGLVDVLSLAGVQVARLPAARTTLFVNTYAGEHRVQHLEAVAEPLSPEMLLPDWAQAPIVHLAPLANELTADAVDAFPQALLGVTPQGWMRAWDDQGLVRAVPWAAAERVLARADVVILSENDVPDPRLIDEYAEQSRLLVVTRGSSGSSVYSDGRWQHSAAFQAGRQVDPTGAGDVFAAAYLIHFAETKDPLASADFANCVASFAIQRRHYRAVPTLDQVQERWQRNRRKRRSGAR